LSRYHSLTPPFGARCEGKDLTPSFPISDPILSYFLSYFSHLPLAEGRRNLLLHSTFPPTSARMHLWFSQPAVIHRGGWALGVVGITHTLAL